LAELRENKVFTIKNVSKIKNILLTTANDKAISEPVGRADRRGKSASRSQIIIPLRTCWQKVTEFMVPLRIKVTEKFLT